MLSFPPCTRARIRRHVSSDNNLKNLISDLSAFRAASRGRGDHFFLLTGRAWCPLYPTLLNNWDSGQRATAFSPTGFAQLSCYLPIHVAI
jgi:hypothetical protein